MSQRGNRGWGRFPSSKMIKISRKCRWEKCTHIAVLIAALPIHPSTGQFHSPHVFRKAIMYIYGSSPGAVAPPTPSPLRCPLMLCLHVSRQWPERHLLHVLLSMDPTLLSLQVGRYYSRHPYPVPRLQICPCCLVQAADHSDCLPDVSLQAHPVKQAYRGAERDLEPSWVQRCDHVIVPVEEGILMSALLSAPVLLFRALHHH